VREWFPGATLFSASRLAVVQDRTFVLGAPSTTLIVSLVVLLAGALPRAHAEAPPSDALDDARALMAAGDFDQAAQKAREVIAMAPGRGAAHLVLGLACFRAGRYQEALAAFAAARTSATPASPGPIAFNEGSTLFALGRYGEALKSFERAAQIAPDLVFLATVNAAEAALAAGNFAVAERHTTAAKALATTPERQEVMGDLVERVAREAIQARLRSREERREQARAALAADRPADAAAIYEELLANPNPPALTDTERNVLEHGFGLALVRQNRFDAAARHFAQAAALDASDGDSLYMQGIANFRAGAWIAARTLFEQALRRDLDEETAVSARAFLDRLSFGGRRGGAGASLGLSGGAGYDSNVIQGADSRPETITADQVGSAGAFFATGSAHVGYEWLVRKTGFLAAEYDVDQLAYPDSDHQDYSLQDHNLRLRGEWSPLSLMHVGLMGGEELQFSGLSGFRAFQGILTAEPSIAFDELPYTSTHLRLRLQKKVALDHNYDYYTGSRVEVRLGQRVRFGAMRGELAFRHRRERIGTRTATLLQVGTSQSFKFRKRKPTDPVDEASYLYVAPYSYDANAALASLDVTMGRLRLSADASAEILNFRGDSMAYFVVPTMNINRLYESQNRRDLHLSGSLALAARLGTHMDLVLRYDVTDNRSTLVLDVDDRNYLKHVVTFAVEADW
jgi:tetratricopeptide (TPR) repeat protein